MTRFLCWLGLHAWAYEPKIVIPINPDVPLYRERRCYRCERRENPFAFPEPTIAESAERWTMPGG